jgi:hypothetical protein
MPESTYTRRADPELAPKFAKDPVEEGFLEHLNAVLAGAADSELEDVGEPYPTLHVIGVPRSGTTLLYQVLASALDIGYVNNLIAAFWRAPVYGVRLAKTLGVDRLESDFSSAYGRTQGVSEPHEFGYFWNDRLRYPDLTERGDDHAESIDWMQLRRTITNMSVAAGGPIAFKPMILIWHLERIAQAMPATRFVWITRPARETALSLLGMRESLRGAVDRWASLRPAGDFADAAPEWQVVAQVLLIEDTIASAAARLGTSRVLRLSYDRLCEEPEVVVADTQLLLSDAGFAPDRRDAEIPDRFTRGGSPRLEARHSDEVDRAVAELSQLGPAEWRRVGAMPSARPRAGGRG